MDEPSDSTNPLDALVGVWEMEAMFPANPACSARRSNLFSWMKGRRLLVQRSEASTSTSRTVSWSSVPRTLAASLSTISIHAASFASTR